MQKEKISHHSHYFFEFTLLVAGFILLQFFSSFVYIQLLILGGMLATYITFGIIHHKIHHDLDRKIVLEYFLLSLLLFAIFVFLNSSRL